MAMQTVLLFISILSSLLILVTADEATLPRVSHIEVHQGSAGGSQKLRIFGENFAKDPYTLGDGNEKKGNVVTFTDGENDIPLETFVEDSIRTDMIVCWTKRMELGRTYHVRVKVNGEDIPLERLCDGDPDGDKCSFTAAWWHTPLIQKLEPYTGIPGEGLVVKLSGRIVTDRIGSDNFCSENGVCEKITRVWAPGLCQLRNPDDIPYGIEIAENSFEGHIICHPDETFVGHANFSIMYEGSFGRSVTQSDQLRVSADDQLYAFQYYTDANLVSGHEISQEGALLRIEGHYYEAGGPIDSLYDPIWVRTGVPGVDCLVQYVERDEYVECIVGKMPDVMPTHFPGGRGVNVYRWSDNTFGSIDELRDASPSNDFIHFDMTQLCGNEISAYQTRMEGMLIPTKPGFYGFQLKSDYLAKLYVNGEFQTESSGGQWKTGPRWEFTEYEHYLVTVVAMGQSSNPAVNPDEACVEARLLYFSEKKFTSAWTGNAIDDEQIFRYSSVRTQEVQTLKFSGYTAQDTKAEVQTICVEGGSFFISLGMFGTWTEMVEIDKFSDVETALNKMPILADGEEFSVVQPNGNDQCAQITFPNRGNFPPFQVRGEDLDSYTVDETNGEPDDMVSLMMNGRPSAPFSVNDLDQAKLQAAVDSMFETICPRQLTSGVLSFQDFEDIIPAYGDLVNDIEAYCGRKSLMNPKRIYPWTADMDAYSLRMVSKALYVCFAYSGIQWDATFKFKYRSIANEELTKSITLNPLQNQTEWNIWSYACVDVFPTIGKGELIWASLEGEHEERFYVDAVSFGNNPTFTKAGNLSEYRLKPASPNAHMQVLIDHSEVTHNEELDKYSVRMFPLHCGHNFSLFELMNRQGESPLTGDSGSTQLSGSKTTLSVTRTERGSPSVRGSFRVKWQGHARDISVDLSNMTTVIKTMKQVLEGIPSIGNLDVKMSDDSTCDNADAHIIFRTLPGNQDLFEIGEADKHLTDPPSANVEIVNRVDGHVRYGPIPGDLIFEVHDKPQAIPFINNIPTQCSGDCSFEWTLAATPFIDGLSTDTGSQGDLLVISGEKFSSVLEENIITIGNAVCIPTESSATQITCEIGVGSGENLPVIVNVHGLGIARDKNPEDPAVFSFITAITDFEPKEGGYGGSMLVVIDGNGFHAEVEVYIGGNLCVLLEWSSTQLKVLTPEFTADDLSGDSQVNLEIYFPSFGERRKRAAGQGQLTASGTFTVKGISTGKIDSMVVPADLSVAGGDQIQITGTNFGADPTVSVGGQPIEDFNKTDSAGKTSITFRTPELAPEEEAKVCVDNGNGCAVDKNSKAVPTIKGNLKVTSFEPTHGSLFGGTVLTIHGKGFGTVKENVEVMVGGYQCIVREITNTEIICQIIKMCDTVKVTNNGTGKAHDMYFAFDQKDVEISECDKIEWTWNTAFYVKDAKHGIYQVVSETNNTKVPGGVDSGPQTRTGKFEYPFYLPTTDDQLYHIWSGEVKAFRSYSQQVRVKPKVSSANRIVVKLGGQEAKYQTTGSGSGRKKRAQSAQECATDPAIPDQENFYFINSMCNLPETTQVIFEAARPEPGYERTITTSSKLTVKGSRFPTDPNDLEVMLGEGDNACYCSVQSSPAPTALRFVCQADSDCTLPAVGIKKEISVNVANVGFPRKKQEKNNLEVIVLPSIQGMTPQTGSTAGFTEVAITGTGLQNITSVQFSGVEAWHLKIIDDTRIECLSPKTSTGPVTISIGNSYPGKCDITGSKCFFTYSPASTPKVSSVNPTSINTTTETTLTLTGEKFGTNSAAVTVTVGEEDCIVTSLSGENTIECTIRGLPAGKNHVDVRISGLGKASTTSVVTGVEVINDPLHPSEGSIHGGAVVTITGHGFHKKGTSVKVGDSTCDIQGDVTLSEIVCKLPPHTAGQVQVQVVVDETSVNFPAKDFTYTDTLSVTDISPPSGVAGDIVTITGTGFGNDASKLSIDFDGAPCVVQGEGFSDTSFTCELGSHALGQVDGVATKDEYGRSNTVQLTYIARLDSISPESGHVEGGQDLTLIGNGFSDDMQVTVCGEPCPLDEFTNQTSAALVCITPPGTAAATCDVSIVSPEHTLPAAYTFATVLVPEVTAITPSRVGTGGGTNITISGEGFGAAPADVSVLIKGQPCEIDESTFSDTNIECTVPPKTWIEDKVKVVVRKTETGGGRRKKRNANVTYQRAVGNLDLWYVDQWSSRWTWGGEEPPGEGMLVQIPQGQTILLDQNTEILEMLLINGGNLIFDHGQESVELKAKYILITGGGTLQIGTDDEPYSNEAIITLYGHHRDPVLPVYGSKVVAVQDGTFEVHGAPYGHTWTKLSRSALAGDTSIVVPADHVADWPVGADMVVATTGDRFSQQETEKRTIASKTDFEDEDGVSMTRLEFDEELKYYHSGITEEYAVTGGTWTGDYRAEVGLLSRTVTLRGAESAGWGNEKIEKCEAGFDPGQHATQTCFQGRWGEETGSSGFGGHIMAHTPYKDSNRARLRIKYMAATFVGQEFQLGRYPFHSHVNGDMSQSYFIGNAVYNSFNRAFNIHATDNSLVKDNVVYDINGGTFFTEDGVETNNTFENNLCLNTKASAALQNDDLNAAGFWITNPDNIFRHNAVAGCSHMCYWVRLNEFPDGPSFDPTIRPRNIPLGIFEHNSCHSCGEIGLWVFQEWVPQIGGVYPPSVTTAQQAVFNNFDVWNCKKGVETVDVGAILFHNLFSMGNSESDVEAVKQMNTPKDQINGAGVRNSFLGGHPDTEQLIHGTTQHAIVAPFGGGYSIDNVTVYNFDNENSAIVHMAIQGLCPDQCGGFNVLVSGLDLINSDGAGRIHFRWPFEAMIQDTDGSLTGSAGWSVTPGNPTLPDTCVIDESLKTNGSFDVARCPPDVKQIRFAFKDASPSSLSGQDFSIANQWGSEVSHMRKKRFTDKPGWMVTLINGETYTAGFKEGVGSIPAGGGSLQDYQALTNFSFSGRISDMTTADDGVIFRLPALDRPDRVSFNGDIFESLPRDNETGEWPSSLDFATANHGDWIYDDDGFVNVAVKGPSDSPGEYEDDYVFKFAFYKCAYTGCIMPVPALQKPPSEPRPDWARRWTGESGWKPDPTGQNTVVSAGPYQVGQEDFYPPEGSDVIITKEDWIVWRRNTLAGPQGTVKRSTSFIHLGNVMVYGVLEISDEEEDYFEIHVNSLIINGSLIIGMPDDPFTASLTLTIHGDKSSPSFENPDWVHGIVGPKAIATYNGLELHGKPIGVSWTTLATTAEAGSSTIEVTDDVSLWESVVTDRDIEIIITTTSNRVTDTERAVITSANGTTITLKAPLERRHLGGTVDVDGESYEFAAAVGLLTRNIVIQGDIDESAPTFGPRILCSIMQEVEEPKDVHQCYMRVDNAEFRYMGQEGFESDSDYRAAIGISNADNTTTRPIYIRGSSFHDLYAGAIAVIGSKDIEISNNVIHHTVGTSMYSSSQETIFRGNLASGLINPGTYIGRYEVHNFNWPAAIDMLNAEQPVLEGNYVAGSERLAYLLSGDECNDFTPYNEATANWAVSSLRGLNIFPSVKLASKEEKCHSFSNMKFWKNEVGMYYQNEDSVLFSNNVFADHKTGLWALLLGPSAEDHVCEHKTVKIHDSIMLGYLPETNCDDDATEEQLDQQPYYRISGPDNIDCRGVTGPGGERLAGIVFPSCAEGPNKAPQKPCFATQKTNCICGSTEVKGVTFKNFGDHGSCRTSYSIGGNPGNDDHQLPMTITDSQIFNVQNLAFMPRPDLGKVDPGDCVDFDCDGKSKSLFLQDADGKFFGTPGTPGGVIPDAGFQWEGQWEEMTGEKPDKRRGAGDYRIPAPALTDFVTGRKKSYREICEIIGIPRPNSPDQCSKISTPDYGDNQGQYNAFRCTGIQYKMIAFESQDWDAKSRRLSPVLLQQSVDDVPFCYIVNGPQDHGCCSGYNCNKRQSLFHALVVPNTIDYSVTERRKRAAEGQAETDGLVQIYLTSTNPEKMRFLFVDPDNKSCIVAAIYYTQPNRIDIYIEYEDGSTHRVTPVNGRFVTDNGKERFILDYVANEDVEATRPTCADPMGSNFIHRDARIVYFVLKGRDKILVVRSEQIIVSFNMPTVTEDEFFASDVILENLAALLNVLPTMVRTVKVISSADGSRRKRSTEQGGITVTVEIGKTPADTADQVSNTGTTQLGGIVMTSCQDQTISAALAVEVNCEKVLVQDTEYIPAAPATLRFEQELKQQYEGGEFIVQPKLRAYDTENNAINHLGIPEDPWQMTATIKSGTGHVDAVLGGTTTISSVNGWFNFTNLVITHAGLGYVIEFDITKPTSAADLNLKIESAAFDVDAVPMTAGLYAITSDDIVEGEEFSIILELRNKLTDQRIEDITWRGHSFDVDCGLPDYNDMSTLSGNGSKSFDTSNGRAPFEGLSLSGYGPIYLECHVVSTPAEFDFYFYHKIYVLGTGQVGIPRETSNIIVVRSPGDFSSLDDSQKAQLEQMVLQDIMKKFPDVIITVSTISEGSILITFTVEGATLNVTAMSEDLCTSIKEGQSYTVGSTTFTLDPYMTVDGQDYYGTACGATESKTEGLHPGYIALIAVLAVLCVAVAVVILLWKFKVIPKTKTHEVEAGPSEKYSQVEPAERYTDNGKLVHLGRGISHEGTFTSLSSTLYHSHINVDMRNTPPPGPVSTETPGLMSAEKHRVPNPLLVPSSVTKSSRLDVSPVPDHRKHWKY